MTWARGLGIAVAAVVAVVISGCGFGAGESSEGEVQLAVTRDWGAQEMLSAEISDPAESETVIRLLEREAEITTRYGGGFVQSIDGVAGGVENGRSVDWFFFVNGIESPRGAADVPVRAGDRIWWDHRDWTDAMRAPAVVGSWPEPFAQAATPADERRPVVVECFGEREPCEEVTAELEREGVDATLELAGNSTGREDALRLLVGPWGAVAREAPASLLDAGPATSGVFARFRGDPDDPELEALDERARVAARLGPGSGLIAALRDGERPPAWLVTGTDAAGVEAAAAAVGAETLANRYAVAVDPGGQPLPVPVTESEAGQ